VREGRRLRPSKHRSESADAGSSDADSVARPTSAGGGVGSGGGEALAVLAARLPGCRWPDVSHGSDGEASRKFFQMRRGHALEGARWAAAARDGSRCQVWTSNDCRRGPWGRKIVWVFTILHKSLCEHSLWPKWLRRRGEVVVYSPPGESLGGVSARFWACDAWMPRRPAKDRLAFVEVWFRPTAASIVCWESACSK
jgi:hypothetical protein